MRPKTTTRSPIGFETERLVVRSPRLADASELHAAIVETLPSLRCWMPWAQNEPSVAETRASTRAAIAAIARGGSVRLHVFDKLTDGMVGVVGLQAWDRRVPSCEIGYWCRARCEGQGLMTEALKGLVAYAFSCHGLQRLTIRCNARNGRSRALAERAGFMLEGTLHHDSRDVSGALADTLLFALTRDRWQEAAK